MIFGITGKIASGKTEVMKIFEQKGFFCIYADKVVHDLYGAGGEGAKRIEAVFGKKFLLENGAVDRNRLRDFVFNDENNLKLLNNVIHPIVYEEIKELIGQNRNQNVAIESVYFDTGFLDDFVDKIIWIERTKDKILTVLVDERSFSSDLAETVYDSIAKSSNINLVVKNDSDLDALSKKIEKFLSNC